MLVWQYVPKDVCRRWHCRVWEQIDSHDAGSVVCPFTTGRSIGTETFGMDNVFPPDDLYFGLDTNTGYLDPWYRT